MNQLNNFYMDWSMSNFIKVVILTLVVGLNYSAIAVENKFYLKATFGIECLDSVSEYKNNKQKALNFYTPSLGVGYRINDNLRTEIIVSHSTVHFANKENNLCYCK